MYALKVNTSFAASHQLPGHAGPCSRLHGHTWQVTVRVAGEKPGENGMLIDFHDLKSILGGVIEELDHRNLNDLEAFSSGVLPTAENLARYIYERIDELLPEEVRLVEVEVGESSDAWALYRAGGNIL